MAQSPHLNPASSIFGGPTSTTTSTLQHENTSRTLLSSASSSTRVPTPNSMASSSNNTYIMPNSPAKTKPIMDGYRPKITRTQGQRPACLVNASVTYCGNDQ